MQEARDARAGSKKILPPATEQEQAGRQGEQHPALRNHHCEEEIFPGGAGLVVLDLAGLEYGESEKAAVEEQRRKGKRAAPSPERPGGQGRARQTSPDQAALERHPCETKEAIEKIGADRVGEGNSGEDRAFRPERGPFGKVANELNVQREVAEVVR